MQETDGTTSLQRTVDVKFIPESVSVKRIMETLIRLSGPVLRICHARDRSFIPRPGKFYLLYIEFARYEDACTLITLSNTSLRIGFSNVFVNLLVTPSKRAIENALPDLSWRTVETTSPTLLPAATVAMTATIPQSSSPSSFSLGEIRDISEEEYMVIFLKLKEQCYGQLMAM